jgi:hypothetical protein
VRSHRTAAVLTAMSLAGALAVIPATSETQAPSAGAHHPEATMTSRASGTFEVNVQPPAQGEKTDPRFQRIHIDKRFHGDFEGTSQVEMLTAGTAVEGSAGYVAIERLTGTLKGRHGTFVFQHLGTMAHGAMTLEVSVVPDSGTGQLTGLAGKMNIIINNGQHAYEFDYTLADEARP